MANKDGIARDKIVLPVDANGDIDYPWLENNAMTTARKKYTEYLVYSDTVRL